MIITTFEADGFRNLAGASLRPHPVLNLVIGANGAGKSSLLEAIQCLATGAGFRSRRFRDHLAHGADEYVLRAELRSPDGATHRCGVRRGRDGALDARLDFESVGTFAAIARVLPVKVLTPESHLLIQGTPDERRRFVDWGCFHGNEAFLPVWRRYRRALSQRNELLREGGASGEVGAWDEALASDGERLHAFRSAYVEDFAERVKVRAQGVDFPFHVKLDLRSGWASSEPLNRALARNLDTHRRMRTTTDGPHRAELAVRVGEHAARDVLSRGQQKLLVYLMHLAQLDALAGRPVGSSIDRETRRDGTGRTEPDPVDDDGETPGVPSETTTAGTRPVVLCDDLGSELDGEAGATLLGALVASGSQVFVTATAMPEMLPAGRIAPPGTLADAPSDTMLSGPEIPDPHRSFAVFTLDAGRLRD